MGSLFCPPLLLLTWLQIPMLLHGTIASNIRLGANDSDVPPEAVREAARLVLADSWIDNLPNGYDTVVNTEFRPTHVPGERAWVGVDLSLAQRQQIGLARLVLRRPRIALLGTSFALPTSAPHIVSAVLTLRVHLLVVLFGARAFVPTSQTSARATCHPTLPRRCTPISPRSFNPAPWWLQPTISTLPRSATAWWCCERAW